MFLSDRSDMLATEWNEQRRLIFKDVIGQLQIPLQQYIKNMYTKKAATIVGLKCESKLEDMLMSGPIGHDFDKWEPEKIDEDELNLIDDDQYDDQDQHHVHDSNHYRRKSNKPARPTKHRILSICPESEGDRVTFVMLDEDGIVLDTVIWNHMPASLLKLQNMHHENKTQWQKQVSDFIHLFRKHDPVDAIAICITGMNAVRTREIIEYLLKDIRKEHLPLEYVPDHIAKIYESSSKAKREFPNQSLMVKRAVSIGRFLNDPLTEIAGLFNDVDQDILMYKFHPLQDMLSKELLMQFLEKAFVRVVNKVGLDINRVTQHKHLQSTARFVSGWGPRKADYILKWVAGLPNSIIMQRRQLIHVAKKSDDANPSDDSNLDQDEKNKADDKSVQGILGRNVFYVCAGFIKVILSVPQIRAASMGGRDVTLDVLDNTRIHPESYTYAVDMAVDALDGVRDSQTHLYVEKAMKDPTKLDDLDLDAHAEHLLSVKKIRKHTTLKNIKAEFHCGFKDPRNTYRKLSDNEVFDYVTGESDQTLNRNIMVHAQVIRISERGIKLALTDNPNITGFMKLSHLDSRDPIVCDSRDEAIKKCKRLDIEEGAVVECVILEVQKDRYSVVLSMNPHDMANAKNKDFMTDVQVTPRDVIRTGGGNNQSSSSSNRQRIKRSINHPSFRNFDYQQAMEYLNQQGQVGNVVIRPSSKGYDHLTITYMFFNQQIINLDVVEKDKQDQNSLGRILLVSQKQYSDLDEIVYKCVEMELEHARKLMEHAKFSELSNSQIEQLLLREKSENPRGIPYRIGLSEKHPGKFTIFYVPSVKVKQQIVSLVPDGYRYNHRVFKDAVKLLNAFKKSNDGKGSASSAQNSSSSSSHHHRQGSSSSNHHSSSGASSSRTHDNNNGRSSSSRQW
ncbi:hypothetical protein AKO1_008042 [Acrasis kona]|uniref:S1 motif domain-containing protein n=1 Tax=Acrasis kona TaxID=1008807 RepID=A0AAW2YRB1_9EUKA